MGVLFGYARMRHIRRRHVVSWSPAFLGACAAAWFVTYFTKGPQVESLERIALSPDSSANGAKPIDVPLALLCDYYEHGIEHAPPRDPRGVMQRREDHYRAPPDPFDLLHRRLSASPADAALARQIDQWQQNWACGRPSPPRCVQALERAARQSTLNTRALIELGRAVDFLADDEVAAAFFRAAFAKAARDFAGTQPGSTESLALLRQLDQTKALWRLNDFNGLEQRFRLTRWLNPPLSVESRRAGCLLADALFYQDRFAEAADLILTVQSENLRVGDLGALDRSDLSEMEYLQGYLTYCAGRFDQAIPHLRRVLGTGEHDRVAARCLFEALLQAGRLNEAQSCCDELLSRFHFPASSVAVLTQKLEQARQSSRWRQSVSVNGN